MKLIIKFAALLAGAILLARAAHGADIPAERFFQKPATSGAAISPDGHHVALRMLSPRGRTLLNIVDTDTHEQKVVANFNNADVSLFYWQSDMRLVYSVINVDHEGDVGAPGLYAVDRDGKDFAPLSPLFKRQRSFADSDFNNRAYLAAPSVHGFPYRKADAMAVIVQQDQGQDLALLDTHKGRVSYLRVPRQTYHWLFDAEGTVRVAMSRHEGKEAVWYKDGDAWRELPAPQPFKPLLYAGGKLYVSSRNGKDQAAVYRYDLQQNALEAEPLITVPGFDADGYFIVDDSKLLGYRINTDSENTVWFDPAVKAIQAEVDARLPDTINTISVGAHNQTPYVLVDSLRDTQDHIYLLYHRDSKKLLRLGPARDDLPSAQMAAMAMVRYPARDGLQIPAYITFPKIPAGQPAPAVVLIGDPQWSRSAHWEWDAEVQFLASRGYLVIQPQPRGIAGFGRAHEEAGARQWGSAIQDDIADAVKWAVAQGHADPARVCIAGGGYGGYAAMMGLIRDAAVFKCGISWSGITDIASMYLNDWEDVADTRALPQLRATVGDPRTDADWLKEVSPLHQAARIKRPVLLAYGKEDKRVPFSEGRKFHAALTAAHAEVEWLEYTPSVEDWKTQGNRIDLWRHIEAFLARHIGPRTAGR
ncbi:alpha/beta hydrolase family protein [Duganella callida]|uniref:S9 family peptidase n=1 Tax=Duganella callida TaxID=2561932 RepID=A0A4Y9STL4_9BURK|nr:prolyl oligopeptidase family serine peptidase [Duganella callida]TFW29951.1 S9 family peptidase [Duganella callida]